jgi:hypothetical protein
MHRRSSGWLSAGSTAGSSVVATALVLTTAVTGLPTTAWAQAPAVPSYEEGKRSARDLTEQGQASFDAGDYVGAALAWRQILDVLPEDSRNRAERENALLIALEGYKHAYRRNTGERGQTTEADVQLLRDALALCRSYTTELQRVHGPQTVVGAAVVESRTELESMLSQAGATPAAPPVFEPLSSSPQLERNFVHRGPSGTGLIAAGASTMVVGLAMTPLIIVGARQRRAADDDLARAEEDMDDAATRDAEDRRRSGNAMLISGAVLTGVLVAGGATMLGIGLRRRVRYMAFAPALGPAYVGASVQGRF